MIELIEATSSSPSLFVIVPIFIIVFLLVYISLRDAEFCGNTIAVILALCVTILGLIGLFGDPGVTVIESPPEIPPKTNTPEMNFKWLLLPYEALAISIIVILLLLIFYKVRGSRITKKTCEIAYRIAKRLKERRNRDIKDFPRSDPSEDRKHTKLTHDDRLR